MSVKVASNFLDQHQEETNQNWTVIGAGLCGLAACQEIERRGGSCLLLEETSEIGGKLKTEMFEDSYLLDHGFQVLLPAYTELQRNVNLKSLDLKFFKAGAIIKANNQWLKVADPFRNPGQFLNTLFSNVGTFRDKLLVLKLRVSLLNQDEESLFRVPLGSSLDYLQRFGFSEKMIENFWRPFFAGIFLEDQLETEAVFLRFLFKMFSESPVAVPARGIGQLPKLMFAGLKRTELKLNTRVSEGGDLNARVIDTRPAHVAKWGSVTTLYFLQSKVLSKAVGYF